MTNDLHRVAEQRRFDVFKQATDARASMEMVRYCLRNVAGPIVALLAVSVRVLLYYRCLLVGRRLVRSLQHSTWRFNEYDAGLSVEEDIKSHEFTTCLKITFILTLSFDAK